MVAPIAANRLSTWLGSGTRAARPGVRTAPGEIVLTRMARSFSSLAHVRANDRMAALPRRVGAERLAAVLGRDRADQDHRRAVVEQGQCLLHGEQRAAHVGVERQREVLDGGVREPGPVAVGRVGDDHVEAAPVGRDPLVEAVEVVEVGGVGPHAGPAGPMRSTASSSWGLRRPVT